MKNQKYQEQDWCAVQMAAAYAALYLMKRF
jgi:hypothetical protein